MVAAAIIVFRELFEAGLIVGIVLAVTRGLPGSRMWIAGGVLAGLAGSAVLAAAMGWIAGAFEGTGQEILNAAILGVTVVMLGWHLAWMARHGRELAGTMRAAGQAVVAGTRPLTALAVVVGLAVLREGSEVVLFLYGVAATEAGGTVLSTILGAAAGALAGGLLSALAYAGLLVVPARRVFVVTSVLIAVLAAGMAAQGVALLEQAGVVELWGTTAWNTAAILPESGLPGRVLHALVGYSDQPTVLQVAVYGAVLAAIALLMRLLSPRPAVMRRAVPGAPAAA